MHYLFADYGLDTQRQELRRDGEPVKRWRQAFQVLVYLLAHRDQVVLKQELLDHLRPDQFVGDEALKSCIEVLALAQDTVQRYDGGLSQVSGEGFLALFGAPVAQEDHARRAVLAALDLRQRTRTDTRS